MLQTHTTILLDSGSSSTMHLPLPPAVSATSVDVSASATPSLHQTASKRQDRHHHHHHGQRQREYFLHHGIMYQEERPLAQVHPNLVVPRVAARRSISSPALLISSA